MNGQVLGSVLLAAGPVATPAGARRAFAAAAANEYVSASASGAIAVLASGKDSQVVVASGEPTVAVSAQSSWTLTRPTDPVTLTAAAPATSYAVLRTATGEGTRGGSITRTVLEVELKVTHPTPPASPTGSPPKYDHPTPTTGSADNLFSTWINEQFRIDVRMEPASIAAALPPGFIAWSAAGFTIPDSTTNYTFSWSATGVKDITVQFPSCGIIKTIRVDVPDVGAHGDNYALLNLVSAAAVAPIIAYGVEARDYCNTNYPVGPQRDAIRHAMWNALSVSSWLVSAAEIDAVTTGHEYDNCYSDHEQAFNSTMDLKHNDVGQTADHSTSLGNPDRPAILTDLGGKYSSGVMWIWAAGASPTNSEANSEGILIKSDRTKIH